MARSRYTSMKKQLVPIIILIVLLFIGGAFFLSRRPSPTSLTDSRSGSVSEQSGVEKFTGSVMDLLKRKTAMKCTASSTEKGAEFSGTYYVDPASGRARIDTESASGEPGKPQIVSHVITDKDYAYIWQEGQKTGMKLSTKTAEGTPTETKTDESSTAPSVETAELNKNVDYSCSPWVIDAAMFTVPSDVTFENFEETMKQYAVPSGPMDEQKVKDLMKQYGADEGPGQ